ncbi:hypothetical protein [Arenimonas fontis]|uniref:Uncharacterized protein n=1 Tax=Arenimonas fontis TaxID=2608255 RepID=A0A5B2ZFH7_9GAMM|nr:hypothetical protein [Arenimonas fontis]KAA2285842.1 hypothetical protein F0415_04285 [Arenimonas fontis]
MNRALVSVALLLSLGLVAGCGQKAEQEAAQAPVVLTAPTNGDDAAWKAYLAQVIGQNQAGVTDRIFSYYLPKDSRVVTEADEDGRSQYDRQLDNVNAAVQRTVLPGNMLAFGSPDSAAMADLIVKAFEGAAPDALQGSQVLFIGKAEDAERVRVAVEAAGARYIFVEAK